MVEPETNEPITERISKMQIQYHQLLLLGINRARDMDALGQDATNAVDALISILPPEVLEDITPILNRLYRELQRKLSNIVDPVEQIKKKPIYVQEYNRKRLSVIIRSLDEHGLLREFRREEVGYE
jgi:biotin-(acetyl-CoA carboxylase) ligase